MFLAVLVQPLRYVVIAPIAATITPAEAISAVVRREKRASICWAIF